MRLILLGGVLMVIATYFVVTFGFKRTEELRSEDHVEQLMREPRTASFGVPVGLEMGLGGTPAPAVVSAQFDDGLVASLVSIKREGGVNGGLVASISLSGGGMPTDRTTEVRLSETAPIWVDHGYSLSLLQIESVAVVLVAEKTGGATPTP